LSRQDVLLSFSRLGLVTIALIGLIWATAINLAGQVTLGPLTGSATLSIIAFVAVTAVSVVGLILLVIRWRIDRVTSSEFRLWLTDPVFLATVGFLPFTTLAIISVASTRTTEGFQGVIVWCLFAVTVPLVAWGAQGAALGRGIHVLRFLAMALSVAYIVAGVVGVELYAGRSFAIVALIFLAATIFPQPRGALQAVAPYVVFVAIIVSASRTATAVALVAIGLVALRDNLSRGRTALKAAAVWLGGALFFALALSWEAIRAGVLALAERLVPAEWGFEPSRDRSSSAPLTETLLDRFFGGGGDRGISAGDLVVNTNGRIGAWTELLKSFEPQNWLLGNGAGSASRYLKGLFPDAFAHPHNEYLRILYDFGIVGALLFAAGTVLMLVGLTRIVRETRSAVARGATLAVFAVAVLALTDNPFVYGFVMLPLGLFVGAAFAEYLSRRATPHGSRNDTLESLPQS
jgi:hypothetical protein